MRKNIIGNIQGDNKNNENVLSDYSSSKLSFLNAVENNKANFSKIEIRKAKAARELQCTMGYIPDSTLKKYIKHKLLENCGVSEEDVDRATEIYGVAEPIARGKMTSPSQRQSKSKQISLPSSINKDVMLYMDIFYVNGNTFLHIKSKDVEYVSIEALKSREMNVVCKKIKKIIEMYKKRGFTITDVYGDNEFNNQMCVDAVLPSRLHICTRGEHVPIVERSIRTIKEKARVICQSLPYDRMPKVMVQALLGQVEIWLNQFPPLNKLDVPSPATILRGDSNPDCNVNRVAFGTYVMVYTGTNNTMETRAVPAVALKQSNIFGGYYFLSLQTSEVISSNKWCVQPMSEEIIEMVHELADSQGQPIMPGNIPIFNTGTMYSESSEEENNESNEENTLCENVPQVEEVMFEAPMVSESDDVSESEQGTVDDKETTERSGEYDSSVVDKIGSDYESEEETNSENEIERDNSDSEVCSNKKSEHECENDNATYSLQGTDIESDVEETYSIDTDTSYEIEDETSSETLENMRREERPRRNNAGTGVSRLEPELRGKRHSEEVSKQCMVCRHSVVKKIVRASMTQMSAKRGFKEFGNQAIASMFKELKQLHVGAMEGKPVVEPVNVKDTSPEQRKKALEAVALIKLKRSGDIKSRVCANGKKQKWYLKGDEDFSSPTAMLESIILTLVIDALEERDIAIVDVPGAYLHAELQDETVLLVLRDELVDIMCEVSSEYKRYVEYRNGKKILYLRVLRALYGCLESALLWYNLYSTTLRKMGFELNPYDSCVANKMIDGHQCTVAFYVDDNKISHRDPKVVTRVINELKEHFGDLKIKRGNRFDLLGMDVEIKNKKVHISMIDHLKNAIEAYEAGLGLMSKRHPAVPGRSDTYDEGKETQELNKKESEVFHTVTAKLLHVCKRARLDIEPVVAYLCTRVSCSTVQDRIKLDHLIRYVKRTLNDVRIVGARDLKTLLCWIDAAYAVHPNMRGQTGGTMSFGTGMIHGRSSKQKLNSKSPTESELIAVSEYLPFHIWVKNFLEHQGYTVENNVVFQDNQSAIRLEKNGRNSCTGNSRHIDIKYFFVKDRVDKGEFRIEYCGTEDMIADFFTKFLQGRLFRKFRDFIMGYVSVPEKYFNIVKIKEDVELSDNNGKSKNKKREHETVIYNDVKGQSEQTKEDTSLGNKISTGNELKSEQTKEDTSTGKNVCTKVKNVSWSDIVRGKKSAGKL